MSRIVNGARNLLAVLSPMTGTRSSGTVTVTASGSDVTVPRSTYAVPVVGGQVRPDLACKVDEGPNDDKSWTATNTGTDITFISNIGGARHNFADGTKFYFDPGLSGISSLVASGAFTSGAQPASTELGTVLDAQMYETMQGPLDFLNLRRSAIKSFPSILITWQNSEPVDGSSVDQTSRVRMSNNATMYREIYQLSVFVSRNETDHHRREQGLYILDRVVNLLTDRHMVDGCSLSNPGGVQIISRYREAGNQQVFQKYYIYTVMLSAMAPFTRTEDSRTYNDWDLANIDVLKPQDPALPNQGDLTLIDDMEIDMTS